MVLFGEYEMRDLNNLNARIRGSLARPRLDGDDTMILSNPSISFLVNEISKVYTKNKKGPPIGWSFFAKMR